MSTRTFFPVLIALFCLAHTLFGDSEDGVIRQGEYANQLVLAEGSYTLYWTIKGGSAHFGIAAKTAGWVALGIDPEESMRGADMIIGRVEDGSRVTVLDCFATGPYGPHPRDEELGGSHDLTAEGGREQDGVTVIEFARPLAARDKYDKPIPQGTEASSLPIIWAFAATDNVGDFHAIRGSAILSADQPALSSERTAKFSAAASYYGLLVPVHAALMGASFLGLFIGMAFPRYFKRRKWWLKTHRRIGIAGAALGLIGVGTAVALIAVSTRMHLRVVHSFFGVATIAALIVTPLWGSLMLKNRSNPKLMRAIHRWIGRATLASMLATIVLGLFQAGVFQI